eukprot:scaffold61621_cov49-Cyclotella_meneghiniana.AAC.2
MMLRKVLDQERPQELPLKGWPKAFKRIWARQRKIGFENFVKGWVTKEWRRVLQSRRYQSKDAVSQVAQMITAIWETLCEPLWELRNNILARTDNPQKTLQERLHWFKRFAICGTGTCPEASQADGFCKRGESERTESNDGVVRGTVDS